MAIEDVLKELVTEVRELRLALKGVAEAGPEERPETPEDTEMNHLRNVLNDRKIRYAKNATLQQLKDKIAADDKKQERVAKAGERVAEKLAAKKEEPKPAAPVTPVKKTATPDEVRAAMIDYSKANGKEKLIDILRSFDAKKFSEVAVAEYDKLIEKLKG